MSNELSAYDHLSKEELLQEHHTLNLKYHELRHELDQMKRLVFGSRHERFESTTPDEQLSLGLNPTVNVPVPAIQSVSYDRAVNTQEKKKPHARMKLPADLPREIILIEPDEDVSSFRKIGEEITEELEYTPGKFFVRRFVRPKYARPESIEGKSHIVIGDLPGRVIEKGLVGPALLSHITTEKYCDHKPLFRLNEGFKRVGINLASSTTSDLVKQSADRLEPIFDCLHQKIMACGYLEGDETTIRVQDRNKKGKTHLGYYWVFRAPLENMVLFKYQPGRGREGPREWLKEYTGYLQSDGYGVYDDFEKNPAITLVGCLAHARRKFVEAQSDDRERAEYVLKRIQELYAIERHASELGLDYQQRYELRQDESVTILETLEKWMIEQYAVTPSSNLGQAIAYSLKRWKKLTLYTKDGKLNPDNNLVENSIRPIALGRKNYLFAGSHNAAHRAAMIYSLMGTCKINNVNPYLWLKDVFERLPSHPINRIEELLPQNSKFVIPKYD